MSSAPRSSGGGPRDAAEPAGDGVVWHSTCGYAECVEPSRYAADFTCKGCRRVKYCTFGCQKADWKRHKPACKADEAADEAAAREGALVARPRANPPRANPPPASRLIIDAAFDGDLKRVEALLRLGTDVNAADEAGFTPLYVASEEGRLAVVAALLAVPGVAVNAATMNGCTPLYVASQNGHAPVVAALLATPGVAVNAAIKDGSTPLIAAAERGHVAIVSCLLAAPGVAVNSAKLVGATPLHAACVQGQAAVVSALLAHPAVTVSPRTTRVWGHYPAGSTPLLIARAMGRLDIAALLEARGGVL